MTERIRWFDRDHQGGRRGRRRQGRQPRRVDASRAAGAAGVRRHRAGVPRGRGRRRRARRPARARRERGHEPTSRPLAALAADLRELVHKAGIPDALRRRGARRVSPAGRRRLRRRALVGDRRGLRDDVVRRHERDVHQRARRRRSSSRASSTAGPRCSARAVLAYRATQGVTGRARDRGRRAAHGRLRPLGRDVHRRPGDRRPRRAS